MPGREHVACAKCNREAVGAWPIFDRLPQKSILVVMSFVFPSCDFVGRSVCTEKQRRSTKSHEKTRTEILDLDVPFEARRQVKRGGRGGAEDTETRRHGDAETRGCGDSGPTHLTHVASSSTSMAHIFRRSCMLERSLIWDSLKLAPSLFWSWSCSS